MRSASELHHLTDDRAEAADVAKDHPEIVARLTKLALDWKATLPEKPNPECISTTGHGNETAQADEARQEPRLRRESPPAARKAFARWDTNKDGILTLDEYKAGLKGQEEPRSPLQELRQERRRQSSPARSSSGRQRSNIP